MAQNKGKERSVYFTPRKKDVKEVKQLRFSKNLFRVQRTEIKPRVSALIKPSSPTRPIAFTPEDTSSLRYSSHRPSDSPPIVFREPTIGSLRAASSTYRLKKISLVCNAKDKATSPINHSDPVSALIELNTDIKSYLDESTIFPQTRRLDELDPEPSKFIKRFTVDCHQSCAISESPT